MSKTFVYRLFGIGKVPRHAREQIHEEGVVLQEEGLSGTVTFKKFRAPGRRYSWRRNWFSGSIVLTREHFLAFAFSRQVIGVAWQHPKIDELHCSVERNNRLCVAFDVAAFHEGWSGNIVIRFSTPLADTVLQTIRKCRSDANDRARRAD